MANKTFGIYIKKEKTYPITLVSVNSTIPISLKKQNTTSISVPGFHILNTWILNLKNSITLNFLSKIRNYFYSYLDENIKMTILSSAIYKVFSYTNKLTINTPAVDSAIYKETSSMSILSRIIFALSFLGDITANIDISSVIMSFVSSAFIYFTLDEYTNEVLGDLDILTLAEMDYITG